MVSPQEYDFAAYGVPSWIRTRASIEDGMIQVRCPVLWLPFPTSRLFYRFSLDKIKAVEVEPRFDVVAGVLAFLSSFLGLVLAWVYVATGRLLPAIVVAVSAALLTGLAVIVGAKTRISIRTEHHGEAWFEVASAERHEAEAFAAALLHAVALSTSKT